jgi:hypothetical protein
MSSGKAAGLTVGLWLVAISFLHATLSLGGIARRPRQEQRETVHRYVQLADRIVVLSSRPGTIRKQIRLNLPRPRDLDSPDYLDVRDEIFHTIGMSLKVGAV